MPKKANRTLGTWQTKDSRIVYENPWIFVHEDKVVFPNGHEGIYGVVESKSSSVFIVPLDQENNTYIVKQEHYTTREASWQCVAGRTDGEPIEIAAKRELREEAGVQANTIEVLTNARTASGITTFQSTLCIARDLKEDSESLDELEGILEVKKLPLAAVKTMILKGEITATESIAAFLLAIAHIENTQEYKSA